jgi:hypothetical protein
MPERELTPQIYAVRELEKLITDFKKLYGPDPYHSLSVKGFIVKQLEDALDRIKN